MLHHQRDEAIAIVPRGTGDARIFGCGFIVEEVEGRAEV